MIEKIFNQVSVLKHLYITIDGTEINQDEIITLEVKNNFFGLGLNGKLKIKDSFNLNNEGNVLFNNDNILTITARDFLKDNFSRTFKISKVDSALMNERVKIFDIEFVDEITYKLNNAYISKSFTDTPVNAFKQYLTHLGIDELIDFNDMQYDIVDTSASQSFIVPQNISVLEYFTDLLKQENIRIWQDRTKFYVKKIDLSVLDPLVTPDGDDVVYSDNVANNDFIFKVHDYNIHNNAAQLTNALKPIERRFRFNNDKVITDLTNNLNDISKEFAFNTIDTSNYQETSGEKYNVLGYFETGAQDYEIFDIFIHNNSIDIVVPGSFKYSDIGIVVNLNLKGNIMYASTQLEGDTLINGKYFVSEVSDRIMGDKLINKLTLNRLDSQQPRTR